MNVGVDAARRQDQPFAGNRLGRGADDHPLGDAGHDIGVAGLADTGDASALDADVGFADAGPIDDQRIGDDAVESPGIADARRLAHSVAQHLAAAELAFVAVGGGIGLDFEYQAGVAQAHAVAGRWSVDVGVMSPVDPMCHSYPCR